MVKLERARFQESEDPDSGSVLLLVRDNLGSSLGVSLGPDRERAGRSCRVESAYHSFVCVSLIALNAGRASVCLL